MEFNFSAGNLCAIVGLVGVLMLLIGWFSSDSGMARSQRHDRWIRNRDPDSFLDHHTTPDDRETSAHENLMGGLGRLQMLLIGAALVAVSIFWNRIGAFLGV